MTGWISYCSALRDGMGAVLKGKTTMSGKNVYRGGSTPSPTPPALVAEVCRLAQEEGLSQSQIGKRLGLFKSKVHHILYHAGVKTKFYSKSQHGRRSPEPVEREPSKISLARVPSLEREEVA